MDLSYDDEVAEAEREKMRYVFYAQTNEQNALLCGKENEPIKIFEKNIFRH